MSCGDSTTSYGIDGPFIDDLPTKRVDFPWLTVKLPQGNHDKHLSLTGLR